MEDDAAFAHQQGRSTLDSRDHISSPPSPRLRPSSPPPGMSTISSIAGSVELRPTASASPPQPVMLAENDLSGDPSLPEAEVESAAMVSQSLMHMLSVVGSRLLEVSDLGLAEPQQDSSSLSDDADTSQSSGLDEQPSALSERAPSSLGRQALFRRPGIMSQMLDEQNTPRGGQSPLAASLQIQDTRSSTPTAPQAVQSKVLAESSRRPSQVLGRVPSPDAASDEEPDLDIRQSSVEQSFAPSSSRLTDTSDHHREQLARKLQAMFSLPPDTEILSCFSCWMFRSLLLQGYVYLTNSHLLFYSYLPSREDKVLKSGLLRKRTQRTHRFSHHWALLRGRSLSWYDSQRDPYFPQDHIDLRDVLLVDASKANPRHFRVHTPYRIFKFGVDTETSRDEWVHAIQMAAFRSQNEGDSVRVSIPLEAIIDFEKTRGPDQSDMVCLQVVDARSEEFILDEYLFLHFGDDDTFTSRLQSAMLAHSAGTEHPSSRSTSGGDTHILRDSTSKVHRMFDTESIERAPTISRHRKSSGKEQDASPEEKVRDNTSSPAGPISIPSSLRRAASNRSASAIDDAFSTTPRQYEMSSTLTGLSSTVYPPMTTPHAPPPGFEDNQKAAAQSQRISGWLQAAPRLMTSANARDAMDAIRRGARGRIRPVLEVWNRNDQSAAHSSIDAGLGANEEDATSSLADSMYSNFSVMDTPDIEGDEREAIAEEFNASFALPSSEEVAFKAEASLYRVLPLSGRIYVSEDHICFRSSSSSTATAGRTKMILPFRDIISCAKNKAFRYGYHGLVITVRGHEEIFLEFGSAQVRDECLSISEARIDSHRYLSAAVTSDERSDAITLTDLTHALQPDDLAASITSSTSGSQSEPLATLASLRPKESLHFTILTIGSRGDVQPFLSLAKGLIAEGHRVRIATHAEFGPWIQQHGVEFFEIGGDPAELMRICVENGTFTVSFLREGLTRFRGWLDDLLLSAWHACEGTDVVIESPNAIAGIHISEALGIPYFRSFTMPWSRTRAYPQAFAVPNKKAGGNYNYMTYVIFDQVLWTASSGQVNRWRRDCLGLQPTSLDRLQQHKTPFLYNFSPSLVPKPLDWYDWIHVTGFWFLDKPENSPGKEWKPPADLLAFIERARQKGKKLVYIGWGSITVPDAAATTRCVIEAVLESGVCAILSKGWSDRLSKGKTSAPPDLTSVSSSIFVVESVPHDWLFPIIDAACHHGGAGTLGASLRAGIPTIVKPFFGDQFFWGQQVESLGVGSCVKVLTVQSLVNALRQATQNLKQIERADALGKQIRSENGVQAAIRAIYSDLEYARSLIKRNTRLRNSAGPVVSNRSTSAGAEDYSAVSSPSNISSPSCVRSLSPDTSGDASANTRSQSAVGPMSHHASPAAGGALVAAGSSASRGPSKSRSRHPSRASSLQTVSDEWSVVSGEEGGNGGGGGRRSRGTSPG